MDRTGSSFTKKKGILVRLSREVLQLLGFVLVVAGIGLMVNRDSYLITVQKIFPAAPSEAVLLIAAVCLVTGAYLLTRQHPAEL
jgi:drug/metabolite transporter (DMT)-like permease